MALQPKQETSNGFVPPWGTGDPPTVHTTPEFDAADLSKLAAQSKGRGPDSRPRKTPTRLSFAQVGRIIDLLREKGKSDDNGYYSYIGDYSDEIVARYYGVSVNSVENIREQTCGKLRKEEPATEIEVLRNALWLLLESHNQLLAEFGKNPINIGI